MNPVIIYSPAVPYWGNIPGNMAPGKAISIKGMFPPAIDTSVYSQINLCEGTKDIKALHISIRFNHREVIRNCFKAGHWESEEKGGPFPFELGSEFWIQIVAQQDAYHISVNGQQCWTYRHRIPCNCVNALNIDGMFHIYQVEYVDQNALPPVIGRPALPIFPRPGVMPGTRLPRVLQPGKPTYHPQTGQPVMPFLEPVYNPPTPFNQIIPGGIQPGMMIYISGIPNPNFQRFRINFQCGSAPHPPPDIAFHFDARNFNGTVVRNTQRDNRWGNEEVTVPNFPFQPSVQFDMIIMVQSDKYMVAVNGQHFIEYGHRMTVFPMINTLRIEDDIKILSVRLCR